MFNIPDAYKLDYQVNLKDFIPKVLKSKDKNRIKKLLTNVDERDILIVEDDATTRSASLLYDEAFFIFVIITIDFPQQHLFSRRS